jgi:ribosomal protein L19E
LVFWQMVFGLMTGKSRDWGEEEERASRTARQSGAADCCRGVTREREREKGNWIQAQRYTCLQLRWLRNKKLLHKTQNPKTLDCSQTILSFSQGKIDNPHFNSTV